MAEFLHITAGFEKEKTLHYTRTIGMTSISKGWKEIYSMSTQTREREMAWVL